ncbi:phage protein [Escherichia coli]|uniref:DUF4222 domain-containing protein n=1 Tax=Escherichia coli TaxID=562 RepID=UPI001919BCB3|nr:DUF4222 domain-containing protein [Escherichia coli]CAD5758043.1 phage protein [Escherichia coli]
MFDCIPELYQQYQDDRGIKVTVTGIEENRVVFMREGYPYPCMRPMHNFLSKFRAIDDNAVTSPE